MLDDLAAFDINCSYMFRQYFFKFLTSIKNIFKQEELRYDS